ncbi:hypothetical protein VTN02DRAFT_3155 [Thermoascus thermophilus]
MKGTSILSFKSWPKKIHLPLPRTPRESQQLLSALTSSFRRQLDREYPVLDPSDRSSGDAPSGNPHSSAHSHDRHLKSILDNPLFRVAPSKTTLGAGHARAQSVQFKKRLAEEPMAVFDELVASGSVTRSDIVQCLKAQLVLAGSASEDGVREAMKNSGAGSRVVAWFWASDSATRKMLFKSRTATSTALKFMVTEELQDTIMVWLRMLSKQDLGGLDGRIPETVVPRLFSHFLFDFMVAEMRYGRGVSSALGYYVKVCRMCSFLVDRYGSDTRDAMLVEAGTYLGQWIVDNGQSQEVKEIPATVYDEFREALSALAPMALWSASVSLYHPTHPTAQPLLEYIRELPPEERHAGKDAERDILIRITMDAVQLLLDQEKFREASWLAQCIKRLFADEVSTTNAPDKRQVTSRQADLLHRLDVALA